MQPFLCIQRFTCRFSRSGMVALLTAQRRMFWAASRATMPLATATKASRTETKMIPPMQMAVNRRQRNTRSSIIQPPPLPDCPAGREACCYFATNTITLRARTVTWRPGTGLSDCSAVQVSTALTQSMEAGSWGRVTVRSSHQALEAT